MSKKHFIALASALAAAGPNIPREAFMDLVQAIADALRLPIHHLQSSAFR